jgi:hypothetical protein
MRKIASLTAVAGVLALAVSGLAGAASVEPWLVLGNPSCTGATKTGNLVSGTYAVSFGGFAGSVTVTVSNTAQGPEFSFATDSASHLVTSVVVKGGPNANLYDYGAPGVASDTGLHSPLNTNGKWYGLSHVCFFTEKKSTPPPPKKKSGITKPT